MWNYEYSVEVSDLLPEQIWAIYQNVSAWPEWDSDLQSSLLIGGFKTGNKVKIKPKKGPAVCAVITECEPNKEFIVETKLPLKTKAIFSHFIHIEDEVIKLTHRATISGPLTFLFKTLIGRDFEKHLPRTLKRLVDLAREVKLSKI